MLDGPDPGTPPWSASEVARVVAAAHGRGARVTAHSTDLAGARVCIAARLTFGDTTDIPRFTAPENRAEIVDRLERAMASVRTTRAAGVTIAAGTDFGGGSGRANHMAWEVESLVAAGLEPWEALAAATRHGGDVLGEPDAGRIRPGGPAAFFLVHGDPLSDPAALWRVWRVAW